MTFTRAAVLGAGTMGAGIAQIAASAGLDVVVAEPMTEQWARAHESMVASLRRLAKKRGVPEDEALGALERVSFVDQVEKAAEGADVVLEAVPERIELKHEVLLRAVDTAEPDALICTNTSQLSITKIASGIGIEAQGRVVGLHFFNPVPVMRLVEIVRGLMTCDLTIDRAVALGDLLGKDVVVCQKDSPGFLTSRISAVVRLECLRMLEEGVGSAEDIDRALVLGLNFPIGPLELGDRNGHDTYLAVLESLADTLGERFRPPVTLRNLVAAGRLGVKAGAGIYDYDEQGKRVPPGVGGAAGR